MDREIFSSFFVPPRPGGAKRRFLSVNFLTGTLIADTV